MHHALHVSLTGERQGYYADFAGGGRARRRPAAVLAKTLTRGFLHDGRMSTFRGRPGARRSTVAHLDARVCWATCRPTTRSATGCPATASGALSPGRAGRRRRAVPARAVRRRCSSWARSGRRRRPLQFFTDFGDECSPTRCAAGGGPSSEPTAGREDAVPDPQDPATRAPRCSTGPSAHEGRARPDAGLVPSCIALRRGDRLGDGPTPLRRRRRATTTTAWLVMTQGQREDRRQPRIGAADRPAGPPRRGRAARLGAGHTQPVDTGIRLPRPRGGRRARAPGPVAGQGQDSLRRSMPSWATEAMRVPSGANMRPAASPRPPDAEGEDWV